MPSRRRANDCCARLQCNTARGAAPHTPSGYTKEDEPDAEFLRALIQIDAAFRTFHLFRNIPVREAEPRI